MESTWGAWPGVYPVHVTEADLQNVGPVPKRRSRKSEAKSALYRDVGEEIAEKFHCDEKFLGELNPGKPAAL